MHRTASNETLLASPWQQELAGSFTDPPALVEYLELDFDEVKLSVEAAKKFPFRVTRSFVSRMVKRDSNDPLLRQVLPITDELTFGRGYVSDPVGDLNAVRSPGLLHKYNGRVLLVTTGVCAINCRYCFRRQFPYSNEQFSLKYEQAGLAYIRSNQSIKEVILSGGDPLVLSDSRLADLIRKIESIPHVNTLRIHSRLPVVLPSRVTPEMLALFSTSRLQVVVVMHINHVNEIDDEVREAALKLTDLKVPLFNQAVLLKGVNDDSKILIDLSEALFAIRIIPYYLHLLDKVVGTSHYEVSISKALRIQRTLREKLPGYLVPKMVTEIPGERFKIPL